MDMNTKTTATKPVGPPKTDTPQALGDMVEKGTTQANEAYEKMSTATADAVDLITNTHSTAVKGVQQYNIKFIEFGHANINAAFDFFQKLASVKSPSAFIELSSEHARKQFETLTEQTKQLAALALKATFATAVPLKTGFVKPVNHTA
jgi:phasin